MTRAYFVLIGGVLSGVFLFAALMATSASAGMDRDLSVCTAANDKAAAAACTRIMESGRLPNAQMYIGYFNRGTAWRRAGEPAKAVADFTKVLELKPDFARAYEARGSAQADVGARAEALSDLDAAVAHGAGDWRFLYSRAVLLRSYGDTEAARNDLIAAGNAKPEATQVPLMLALVLADEGDFLSARAKVDQSMAQGREEMLAYYTRAAIAFREGQMADAEADVDRALKMKPDFAAAQILKGRILEARGDVGAARASYDKALDGKTDFFDGRATRGIAKERLAALGPVAEVPKVTVEVPKRAKTVAQAKKDVAEAKIELPAERQLDCKVFLPATGTVVTAKCSE
jgi:tetratricopeptide (TPR) repeat protein